MKKIFFALLSLFASSATALSPEVWDAAAYGGLPGIEAVQIRGMNGTPTTSSETLWPESTAYTFRSGNMVTPTISSDQTSDASGGAGARRVKVTCIDQDYALTEETLTMNGQTGVSLTINCMTVNQIETVTVGSSGSNIGIIYVGTGSITTGKPATVHGLIPAGIGKAASFIYGVPANKTLLCYNVYFGTRNTTTGGYSFSITKIKNSVLSEVQKTLLSSAEPSISRPYRIPLKFDEKTQIQGTSFAAAGTTEMNGGMDCLLINKFSADRTQVTF